MTRKQKETYKSMLPKRSYWSEMDEDEKDSWRLLDCIDMIDSLLCYKEANTVTDIITHRYMKDHVRNLGLELVTELVTNQIRDLSRSKIIEDVFQDSEGVTYNKIVWYDEI